MKNIYLFLPIFFLCFFLGNAQQKTLKHTVEKGETVFQLSRTYNVSPEDIYRLNPSAVTIIRIGEVLLIPTSEVQNQSTPNSKSSLNPTKTNTLTYAVVYGDTKYSLARRFGMSVEELENQNPHIKSGLQAGHILKIESQGSTNSESNFDIVKTHRVLKGETLWGISKDNGLTVEQLVNANSDILRGILQIGQLLKIPSTIYGKSKGSETYLVQRGDTKYGLSKKYDVTIDQLEKENPHIVRMLMAGHTITIPKNPSLVANQVPDEQGTSINTAVNEESLVENQVTDEQETPTETPVSEENLSVEKEVEPESQDIEVSTTVSPENTSTNSFVAYEIKAKETLYGLSKKAGMSISDFVNLNPQLETGAKIGMIIKMPLNLSDSIETSVSEAQSTTNPETSIKRSNKKYTDLSQSIKTVKKNQILLLLPFSEATFSAEFSQNVNFNNVEDEFIKDHLEFYRGVRIANDSAKALGLDFNIDIIETNSSKRNTQAVNLVKDSPVEKYDAILAPFYENDVQDIAEFVQEKNIPVVTTNSIIKTAGLKNLYNGVPSLNSKRNIMLDYIINKGGNIIVVCDVGRKESRTYISNYAPAAKFIEVNKKGSFNNDELESLLDTNKVNYIILESDKNSVFLSITNVLLGQLSAHSIQLALLDKSLIPNTDDVSQKRFVILQMLYPSLTPLKETSVTTGFVDSYKKTYSFEPTQNIKFGFDLTYDTLLRASQATSFEVSAKNDVTEYTILKFDYKENNMGANDNNGIYIIQYNSNGTLKEIK